MKKEEIMKKLLKYLAQHGASSNQEITDKMDGATFPQVATCTKFLLSEKIIAFDKESKKYSCLESKAEGEAKTDEKAIDKEFSTPEQNAGTEKPSKKESALNGKGKRDFSKHKFLGVEYNKSRLVMAILAKYCEDHEPTLAEMKEAWPDAEIKPYGYGLFKPAAEARKVNEEGRQRFFAKDSELIKIKSGKVACTNQITGELLSRILVVAKRHKLMVK